MPLKNPLPFLIVILLTTACSQPVKNETSWCDQLPRADNAQLEKTQFSDYWFDVYEVQDSIFAIYEPHQVQEVISYLIIGKESALLFDTGNGIGDIKNVVDRITGLPISVLNSHSHLDHVGGNASFDFIYGMDTEFTATRKKGLPHERVAGEVSPDALCKPLPEGVVAEDHIIRPYEIDEYVADGFKIDLGNRILEVISIPGHTPDAIGLLDKENGLLWTGDTFYKGAIWLFAKETNLDAYKNSVKRLAALSPSLKHLLPAHNTPLVDPKVLIELDEALDEIERGGVKGKDSTDGRVNYTFDNFTILMNKN
jgi:glyoxylase-like metal-dependent hydrolase (beta-lactamase superfamily II)